MYRNGIKRLLAVILSLCGMIVLSPLLLILCIAIKVDSPGPILFKQKRVVPDLPLDWKVERILRLVSLA